MANHIRVYVLITFVAALLPGAASAQDSDDPVAWIEDNGFDSILFMARCASVDDYGYVYEGAELPVGDGWTVECSGYGQTLWSTTSVQANDGTIYCVLGQRGDLGTGGDQRLSIDITYEGDYSPAQLEATSDAFITIKQAEAFGGAKVWPLWLEAHYDTTDIVLAPNDRSCDQYFGVN